ncbi:MAG: hypothetical protein AAGG75_03205 [Bacteroidota bacterium]
MLEIEQLVLRLPHLSREEGQQISQRIAQRLAQQLPVQPGRRYIDQLNIQLRLSEQWTKDQLVDQITGAILNHISYRNQLSKGKAPSTLQHTRTKEGPQHYSTHHQTQGGY